MKRGIPPFGLPRPGFLGRWGPRALYGLGVGVGGALLSLLLVVASGPRFSNAEQWEAIALGWLVMGGAVLLGASGLSGAFLHRYYVRCPSGPAAALVFTLNVLAVAALALIAAAWAAGI